ncbi:unnamed protein product [Pleuronectes platessa]|uniref:Uncharacterized protein n=1 Tax=Pleuronectes platessa TaxID=8262 RepID=A0A9N7VLG2_PLEPL|nr:unnamed protein product [Pleuronectes platessa]
MKDNVEPSWGPLLGLVPLQLSTRGADKMLEPMSVNVNLIGLASPDVRDKQGETHINLECTRRLSALSQNLEYCAAQSGDSEAGQCSLIECACDQTPSRPSAVPLHHHLS